MKKRFDIPWVLLGVLALLALAYLIQKMKGSDIAGLGQLFLGALAPALTLALAITLIAFVLHKLFNR